MNFLGISITKVKQEESNTIAFRASKPNSTSLLFGEMVKVEIKNYDLEINISEKGLDRLAQCNKSNEAIQLFKKVSKKEPFELLTVQSYDDEPICSAITEGAFRVLQKACMLRYTQLYLKGR